MAAAIGVKFFDDKNNQLIPYGKDLGSIASFDTKGISQQLLNVKIELACDVDSMLFNETGATYLFGPQKGIKECDLEFYENCFKNIGKMFDELSGKNISIIKGSGAAGGLGAGLIFFLNASVHRGFDLIAEYLNIETDIMDSDLVITGEGKMDNQSTKGKAPIGIAMLAKKHNVDCIAFIGVQGTEIAEVYNFGIKSYFPIVSEVIDLETTLKNGKKNLESTSFNVLKLLLD